MTKYFFDIIDGQIPAYDFSGREFPSPEAAYALAELLALDLTVREPVSAGTFVSVSDAHGRRYFLVPVQAPEPDEERVSAA